MKIAIVYPFFAHYRGPILEELYSNKLLDFYFIAGKNTNSPYSTLKLYEFEKQDKIIEVKNKWYLNYFLWQENLVKILKSNNFDGVIFLGDWKYISTWFAIRALRKAKIHCLFWSHGILNKKKSLNNFIKYRFFKIFLAGGFLYSNEAKENLLNMGYPSNLTVIYNSLDFKMQLKVIERINNESPTNNLPEIKRPYLIFTGRLLKSRNLELLFDAMRFLNEENIYVDLIIIGGGPHEENLKNYAMVKGLNEYVKFIGPVYDEYIIGKYFMNSIACVFPGPIGLTVIHSFTYGVPVITNDNFAMHKPEAEVLKDEVNCFLFKDGDSSSLAQKIKSSLNLTSADKRLFRLNAFKVVNDKYNPERQAELIVERLSKLNHNYHYEE